MEQAATYEYQAVDISLMTDIWDIAELRVSNPIGRLQMFASKTYDFSDPPLIALERHSLNVVAARPMVLRTETDNRGFALGGFSADVRHDGVQLVAIGWENLTPELQAALVTAALTLVAWLLIGFGRRWYAVTRRLIGELREPSNASRTPQVGQTVFLLKSGREVAGDIERGPALGDACYHLIDCWVRSDGGSWEKVSGSRVTIERSQIELAYPVDQMHGEEQNRREESS